MAIAFGTAGAEGAGTNLLAPTLPGSIAAGDLLVLFLANKYPPNGPSAITGWIRPTNSQFSGGQGASGIDAGNVFITAYVRVADGADAAPTPVIPSGNSGLCRIFRYTRSAGTGWEYACAGGADNAAGTAWSVTADADPGLTAGDMLLVGSAVNVDTVRWSTQAATATGVSAWGAMAERQDTGTTNGQDCALVVSEHPVTTGTSAAAPVYTMTGDATGTNFPAGASLFLRLRESTALPPATTPRLALLGVG